MKQLLRWVHLLAVLSLVVVFSAACGAPDLQEAPPPEEEAQAVDSAAEEAGAAEAGESEGDAAPDTAPDDMQATTEEAAAEGEPPLPPEPQQVPFLAADGYEQVGTYYPGQVNPGPLVILMHWAPGDQNDWAAIAPWLQNRGLPVPDAADTGLPWLDSSWFPALGEANSFGVFTFTFRFCEGGCAEFDRDGWLNDAFGAYEAALQLPGVDPERIVIIGASIGADGAADACLEGCLGALSLSPGDYLGIAYTEAVRAADEAGKPVWCLAAEGDSESHAACTTAEGSHYRSIIHPGSEHGMGLVEPDTYDPDTMQVILEFLDLTLGLQ